MTWHMNFSGTHAVLLGGSCHLALALADVMIPMGMYPFLTYRDDSGLRRINEYLNAHAGRYTAMPLDLDCFDETLLEPLATTKIHYMVDFAQGDLEGLMASVDPAASQSFFDANISARAKVIQWLSRLMMAHDGGRMVYVSSAAAGRPNPGQGYYAAVKCAAEAMYRNVGLELASRGITTVTLRPGYVDAGRGRRYLQKSAERALAKVPLRRALTSQEVADTLLFLLSDSAVGFNATVLTMDGGMSAGK